MQNFTINGIREESVVYHTKNDNIIFFVKFCNNNNYFLSNFVNLSAQIINNHLYIIISMQFSPFKVQFNIERFIYKYYKYINFPNSKIDYKDM